MDTTSIVPDRQNVAIVAPAVVLSVTVITVFLRLYTRFTLVKSFGIYDWAVAVAYVFTLACGISVVVSEFQYLPRWGRQADKDFKTVRRAWVSTFQLCNQITSCLSEEDFLSRSCSIACP